MENVYITVYTRSDISQQIIDQSQLLLKKFPFAVCPQFYSFEKLAQTKHEKYQSFCKRSVDCSHCPANSGIFRRKQTHPYCHRCSYGLSKFVYPFQFGEQEKGWLIFGPFFKDETDINLLILSDITLSGANEKMNVLHLFEKEDMEKVESFAAIFAAFLSQTLTMEQLKKDKLQTENHLRLLTQKIKQIENTQTEKRMSSHFLFHSLTTLARLAYFDGNQKLEDAVYKLAAFIRYTEQASNYCVSLKEAIHYSSDYLEMYAIYVSQTFSYTLHLPKELEDYRIPAMTLIPLIDQLFALQTNKTSHLQLTVTKDAENIVILLQDSFIQIQDQNQVASILAKSQARLYGLFGSQATLQCTQLFGEQAIQLKIPASKELLIGKE